MKRIVTVKHTLTARLNPTAVGLCPRLRLGKYALRKGQEQVMWRPSPKRSIMEAPSEENFGFQSPHCAASWLRSAAGTTYNVQRGSFESRQEELVKATQRLTTRSRSEDGLLARATSPGDVETGRRQTTSAGQYNPAAHTFPIIQPLRMNFNTRICQPRPCFAREKSVPPHCEKTCFGPRDKTTVYNTQSATRSREPRLVL